MEDTPYSVNLSTPELSENDVSIIYHCFDSPNSVRELSEKIGIAQKNTIARLNKLKEQGFIEINRQGKGKKTLIKVRPEKKAKLKKIVEMKEYLLNVNQYLKENPEKSHELLKDFRKAKKQIERKEDKT